MEINFLGGASAVGSLGMVLESGGKRLLFDYGMTPTDPPGYPMPAPPVDGIYLTHAHVDHSGMIPRVASDSRCDVFTTELTSVVGTMLMEDSLKIARMEGYAEPYRDGDIKITSQRYAYLEAGRDISTGPIRVEAQSAGHIPGASMYLVDDGRTNLLFTGDINTIDTNLVKKCRPHACNVLVLESTYAGREHQPRKDIESAFLDKVEEVVDRGGLAIVPAFAVGRTQEVLMLLERSGFEVWVDGMGKAVAGIYLDLPEYLNEAGRLNRAYGKANKVRSPRSRERAARGDVVVTTSGMLDGGPVLEYVSQVRKDPRSAILLTGYQVEGTNGRLLTEHGVLDYYGARVDVECEVRSFDLSAHAGHSGLAAFARECDPETVVLCHGDNRDEMVRELEGEFRVLTPVEGERVDLGGA